MKKILFTTLLASMCAFAADKVWTNDTGDGKWSTGGNWSDHAAPTSSDTGYTITVSGTSSNDIAGLQPTRLIVTGSSAVRVTGESLTLTEGVQFDTSASASGTLVLPLVLSGSGQQPFSGSSTNTLYLMGAVSGTGGIGLTRAYSLYLAGANTFAGGVRQTDGRVMLAHASGFGSGKVRFEKPVPKIGDFWYAPFHIATGNMTITNDIVFVRDGYTESKWLGSVEIAGGTTFTGECDFSVGGCRLAKSGTANGTITFSNTIKLCPSTESGNYTTTFLPKIGSSSPLLFTGKMTGYGKIYQDNGSSLLQFAAAGNEILMLWLQGSSMTVECKIVDAFLPTTLVKFDGGTKTGQMFNLGGFDQTVDAVYDQSTSVVYTHTVKGGGTARLTMKATADRGYGGQFTDDLTICWMPTTAKTYTLKRTAFATTGGLVVSNGTVALTSDASFPNATRLEVAPGATFSMAAGTSFNAGAQRLDLGTGATLSLADGVNLRFEAIYVDGNRLPGGAPYSTANPISGVTITGGGTVSVPLAPVSPARTATWSGGGGANVRTDENTNWDGNSTPTLDDGLTAVTFATGGAEAAAAGPLYLNGVLFDAPGSFALRSVDDQAVVRLQGGGVDTAAPSSGTRAYTVSSPLGMEVDQTWDVAAKTTLTLSGRLLGDAPTAVMLRTGTGRVEMSGTDDFTGRLFISNGVTAVTGDGLGHTNRGEVTIYDCPQDATQVTFTDATVRKPILFSPDSRSDVYGGVGFLAFYGTNTFTAPITLSGNYVRFRVANGAECRFAGGMVMATGAVRYPVLKSVENGSAAGSGWFVVTNTPLDVTGWWQESANVVFAAVGNKFEKDGIHLSSNSKLRIAVDGAVSTSLRLTISSTATLDLDGHNLFVGSIRDYAEADAGTPTVTSAASAALRVSVPANSSPRSWITFTGAAGLRKDGAGTLRICRSGSTTGTLEVANGVVVLEETGGWPSGREVVVGSSARLQVKSSGSLSREAAVRVASGGTIELQDGVTEHVAELWVDGVKQGDGVYTSAKAPDVMTGAGTLIVGNVGTMVIFR